MQQKYTSTWPQKSQAPSLGGTYSCSKNMAFYLLSGPRCWLGDKHLDNWHKPSGWCQWHDIMKHHLGLLNMFLGPSSVLEYKGFYWNIQHREKQRIRAQRSSSPGQIQVGTHWPGRLRISAAGDLHNTGTPVQPWPCAGSDPTDYLLGFAYIAHRKYWKVS